MEPKKSKRVVLKDWPHMEALEADVIGEGEGGKVRHVIVRCSSCSQGFESPLTEAVGEDNVKARGAQELLPAFREKVHECAVKHRGCGLKTKPTKGVQQTLLQGDLL